MGAFLGIVLAIVIPLFILRIFRKPDFYLVGKYQLILRSLLWGIFAYIPAFLINQFFKHPAVADPAIAWIFIAPLVEELLKGLVLFYLIRRSRITFSLDGALYGFATGIGFAIAENMEYVVADRTVAVAVALMRVFSANLVHASSSAILGMALGISYLRRSRSRRMFLTAGLILAIGLHALYNNVVYPDGASLGSAFSIGAVSAIFVYLAMQHGKKQAQDWIRQKLGMRDRVTPGEVALVTRLPGTDDLLQPVFERFGLEKTRQVEKLLYLQARLGIKRKFLDSIPENDPLHNVVERELQEMRMEMLATERAIGTYAMLFVRGLYTDEMISVWEQMQAKIKDRSGPAGSGRKGGGLWSSLEKRIQSNSRSRGS